MKFSTREDIEAPIDYVFARVTDFAAFERRALRKGAEIRRSDESVVRTGTRWDIAFDFRGRRRKVDATLTQLDPPNTVQIDSASDGLDAVAHIELVPLSQARTRLLVTFDLHARTLTGRLLLQSLRLAKSKLAKRFKGRVLDFAENTEIQYRRDA